MINEGLTVVELHSKLLYALCFKACSEHMYTPFAGVCTVKCFSKTIYKNIEKGLE